MPLDFRESRREGEQTLFIREGTIPEWLSWSPDGKNRVRFELRRAKEHEASAVRPAGNTEKPLF